MKNTFITYTVLAISLIASPLLSLPANASTLVSENFNGYSPAPLALPTGSSPNIWATATQTAQKTGTVVQDSGNLFGQGTSNQFLNISVIAGDTSISPFYNMNNFTGTQTGQVSLNFYDYNDPSESPWADGWILRLGTSNANSNTRFAISVQNGELYLYTGSGVSKAASAFATYSLNNLYSLSIVFNNSAGTLVYDGGSVDSGKMDVWLNGSLVGAGLSNTGNLSTGTNITNFNFTAKSNFRGVLYVDDLLIDNAVTVPEPATSTYTLIGLTVAAFFILRKQFAKSVK